MNPINRWRKWAQAGVGALLWLVMAGILCFAVLKTEL